MALDKSALLELTDSLRSADDGQLMRRLLHTIRQALIDPEAAEHAAPTRTNAPMLARRTATGPGTGTGTRPSPRPVGT